MCLQLPAGTAASPREKHRREGPGCRIWGLGPVGKVPGVGALGHVHATPPAPGGKAAVPCPCVSPCPQGGFQPAPGDPFCVGHEADNDKLPGLL